MLKTASKEYKFVLVGDSAVGKSSLLNRFVDKTYSESLLSTIGVDFKFKRVTINNSEVKLQIWDTAGQQTFRSIVSAYYTSADAIVIVYDITSYESFQNLKNYWIKQAQNNNKNNAKIFILGNKIDQQSRRQIEKFTIDAFMQEHQIDGLFEASAKTGQDVEETFTEITRNLFYGTKQKPLPTNSGMKMSKDQRHDREINRKSIHKENEQQSKAQKHQGEDQYQQVMSVDQQVRRERIDEKNKQERIKINHKPSNKPKNKNYNKSCCLK